MNFTTKSVFSRTVSCAPAYLATLFATVTIGALQANPWMPLPGVFAGPSNIIPDPKDVPGKDFSDYRDRDFMGLGDPEQVVAWDGMGGVRDGFDFNGLSAYVPHPPGDRPLLPQPREVDALSANADALFDALRANRTGMLFSVGDIGVGGAVGDPNIYYVRPTDDPNWTPGFGTWATPPVIDGMNPIRDVDGLEIWGGNDLDDSLRYSVYEDPFVQTPVGAFKVAIWAFDPTTGLSTPHTLTTDLAAAIDRQFGGNGSGPIWGQLVELMDVDAMMVFEDRVTFSIAPIDLNQPGGPPLPNFDGGEIFEYDGVGSTTRFLKHGGYEWNTLLDVRGTFNVLSENVNALEAASQLVPEPSTVILAVGATVGFTIVGRRKK